MLIRNSSEKHRKRDRLISLSILCASIVFCTWLALRLAYEERYYNATGWIILTILFISVFVLCFIKPKGKEMPSSDSIGAGAPASMHPDDEFVLLCSTKDILRVAQIEEALKARDIKCIVLDRHGSLMMPFIPGVEMRIMVPREDYEWSIEILNGL